MGTPKDKDWVPLSSSNVAEAGWGQEDVEVLWVRFHSGGIYEYQGVPKSVFDALCASDSPGRFVQTEIIPNYKAVKVN